MSVREALSYMSGQDRRARQSWEQTRMLCGLIYKVLTGSELQLEFPWDEADAGDDVTDDDLARLRALAREAERRRSGNL